MAYEMRISDWSSDVCSSDLNTVNILLILGLSAALQPLAIQMQTLRLELPAIVIASATLLAFAWDGTLSRLEGLVLVTMGVVFTLAVIRAARRESLRSSWSSPVSSGTGASPTVKRQPRC